MIFFISYSMRLYSYFKLKLWCEKKQVAEAEDEHSVYPSSSY